VTVDVSSRRHHSHELQIDLSAPAAFCFRLVLETSCIVNAPRPTWTHPVSYFPLYTHRSRYIGCCFPRSLRKWPTTVVGCKMPWKENSLISRGFGDFLFTRRVLAFFRVNPAKSVNQPDCFYPARLFLSIVGSTSGKPGETGRGGARKKSKSRRVFFSRYLAANDGWYTRQVEVALAKAAATTSTFKGALCAWVKRLRVSYNRNDETLSRNSLRYLSKANLTIAVN